MTLFIDEPLFKMILFKFTETFGQDSVKKVRKQDFFIHLKICYEKRSIEVLFVSHQSEKGPICPSNLSDIFDMRRRTDMREK